MGAIWEHDSHEVSRVNCLCPLDLSHLYNSNSDNPQALQTLYTHTQEVQHLKGCAMSVYLAQFNNWLIFCFDIPGLRAYLIAVYHLPLFCIKVK
jgi:hypothetical protein